MGEELLGGLFTRNAMFKNLSTEGLGVSGRQSEVIELALSFGFKGLDLDLADFAQQVQTHGLAHARRLLVSSRLKMGTFRLPLVWDETDELYQQGLSGLPERLKLAADLGATRAVTTIAPANDTRPYHENFEFHRRRLSEIGEALAPFKMLLGVEFLAPAELRKDRAYQFIHSLDALATLIGMVRATNVGVVADAWQIHAAGAVRDRADRSPQTGRPADHRRRCVRRSGRCGSGQPEPARPPAARGNGRDRHGGLLTRCSPSWVSTGLLARAQIAAESKGCGAINL